MDEHHEREHIRKNDYICKRCRMMVRIHIPHECDPSICWNCNGSGKEWWGDDCHLCGGSGKTRWIDDEGVPVG